MKLGNLVPLLLIALGAQVASAQTAPAPAPPEPRVPPAESAPPAAPVTPPAVPTPPAPVSAVHPTVAEGTLFRTQRSKNDKGKYEWVCTYNVANLKRSVLLDESCPSTLTFELRR